MKNNIKTGIAYEEQTQNRLQALRTAENTPEEIKNKNVKYLLKN